MKNSYIKKVVTNLRIASLMAPLMTSLALITPTFADNIQGLSIGLGVGYQEQPFVGKKAEWLPIPHFEYQSGALFIKGLKIGVDVLTFQQTKVDIHLKYQSLNFKPHNASEAYHALNQRKSTILLGAGIQHQFDNQLFIAGDLHGDILGRSDGLSANAKLGYLHRVNDHFTLIPAAGITWDNKKHNRYYYGISQSESEQTGIHQYRPKQSLTPHIALGMVVKATDRFHIFGGAEVKFLPSEVKNSPITKKSTLSSFALGINYNF